MSGSTLALGAVVLLGLAVALLFRGRPYWAWVIPGGLAFAAWSSRGFRSWSEPPAPAAVAAVAFLLVALLFGLRPLRARLVAAPLMPLFRRLLPRLGDTERIALEAGTVWWDGELFSGRPDWGKLLAFPVADLSPRERAFLDGPVEEVCRAVDDWRIAQLRDLPPEAWALLKRHGFFGMIIPEAYGGLGFSAAAHSAVVVKLASRSIALAVTVMVPNSLGPAELLLRYGTDEQKRRYLPRLASGEEIPCFALTGPEAGSDAAATQSVGIVCRGSWEGREALGMRLTWNKRYITLGPVSTVIGLAFRLRDPDRLLGGEEDLGITCALVPSHLPGIEIGDRHDALGVPFQNGPNRGRDVFLPLDFIIGGQERAGDGWRMLMESLAAGRSISLPSLAVGGAELAARVVSAYAMVREQFDTPIGRFEGVEEPLARIAGFTYLMNAARRLTLGAVDAGEHPAVLSAIVKAYLTELMRRAVNDAMDIRAGAGIVRGPRNLLARMYMAVPIGITVEGANILTRSMIIYGQGAIRCHPFVLAEMRAVEAGDARRFDRALFGHLGFPFVCGARSLVLALVGPWLARPAGAGPLGTHFGRLSRLSAAFALVSDAAMMTLGAGLKRRERITGRLADALAWMYLASAVGKRFHDDGGPERDLAFARWGLVHAEAEVERALVGVLRNLPNRPLAWCLGLLVFPFGARLRPEDDRLGGEVARDLLDDEEARERLTAGIFRPGPEEPGLGRLEAALAKAREALAVEAKIRAAVRAGRLDKAPGHDLADRALAAGLISAEERERIHQADEARDEVIQVDAFDPETFRTLPP